MTDATDVSRLADLHPAAAGLVPNATKGITVPQVAYWESIFQRLTERPEWQAEMVLYGGVTLFAGAAAMKKRMDDEYPEVKALLVDLELAKR